LKYYTVHILQPVNVLQAGSRGLEARYGQLGAFRYVSEKSEALIG